MGSEPPYDESSPLHFTKREAQAKVGKSVRAKVNTKTYSYMTLPVPAGTSGNVVKATICRPGRQHRRWGVLVKWNIEFTPRYPGQLVEEDNKTIEFSRRKYEAEIIELAEQQEQAA